MSSMLAIQNGPQFVSRIFTDVSGRQFRLTFLVVSIDGEFKGRLISAEPIAQTARITGEVTDPILCLPIACPKNETVTEYISGYVPVVSPFVSLDFLITSQPTRAPSFA